MSRNGSLWASVENHPDLKLLSRDNESDSTRGILAGIAFTAPPARHVHIVRQFEKNRIRR
jgi:hypothetical protein